VVAFAEHGGFADRFPGVNIQEFKCEQVVALVVTIAVGGPGSDSSKQQIVDGLAVFFEDHLEVALFLWQDEAVGGAAQFGHGGFDIASADHAVLWILADEGADVFVDLFLEVADGFTALVFDSDKADGASEATVVTDGCMGGLKDGLAGFSEQPRHGFIDQGLPCFGAGVVAANHVAVVLFEDVRVLFLSAAGQQDEAEQQGQEQQFPADCHGRGFPSECWADICGDTGAQRFRRRLVPQCMPQGNPGGRSDLQGGREIHFCRRPGQQLSEKTADDGGQGAENDQSCGFMEG